MKLTIFHAGLAPEPLRDRFAPYPEMYRAMFEGVGAGFDYDTVRTWANETPPDPVTLDAVLITGSSAGVYEQHDWLPPLRDFIRRAYAAGTPMVGICFGHQVIADALGGEVRKSEKGWGLGRHVYDVVARPAFLATEAPGLAIACSHQDQVITPPAEAEVFLASEFTPNAGLAYRNGRIVSLQPHPEFTDEYALALAELRRGRAPDAVVDRAIASLSTPSDSRDMARWLAGFLRGAR